MAQNDSRQQLEVTMVSCKVDVELHQNSAIERRSNEIRSELKEKRGSMTEITRQKDEIHLAPAENHTESQRSQNHQSQSQLQQPQSDTQSGRVYKKSSPNNKLTLYLTSRDLIVSEAGIDKLQGVLLVDPDFVQNKQVFGQVTLTFRHGREDEEVMGLKFCNEAIMCLIQLYPPYVGPEHEDTVSPLQEALIKRLGPNAHAFTMEITPLAPPSVQLVPAKEYNGAPIGTSYDVSAYMAERADEKLHRETIVRMGIRVIQRTPEPPLPTSTTYNVPTSTIAFTDREKHNVGPYATVEKPFILSDGRVGLEAKLDRAMYSHGDSILVHVSINNKSSKFVRRIEVCVVQHVDVCIFSNGKFKNIVARIFSQEGCPIKPGETFKKSYTLRPTKGSTKNWIALEDSYTKTGARLASTVTCPVNIPEDRNVFAIYVSYYVKVKLLTSAIGGAVSLKLPFTLMHSNTGSDLASHPSPIKDFSKSLQKSLESVTEHTDKQDNSDLKKKDNKLTTINEKDKESRITDVDLIEHCNEDHTT